MLSRREFLQVGVGVPALKVLPQWALMEIGPMPELTSLSATAYFPLDVFTIGPEEKGEAFTVSTDTGQLIAQVRPKNAYDARVEATAVLDLSALGPEAGKLTCAYWDRRWRSYAWAPGGLGHRGNALVPGRDFAHGGKGKAALPFATRIEFRGNIPTALEGLIRPVMYRGDVFGSSSSASDPRRVDLYTIRPCKYYDPISVQVTKPWRGNREHKIDSKPTRGFQQCSRILKLNGKNGRPLTIDGGFGDQTEHALKLFMGEYDGLFHWGLPGYIKDRPRCTDSELYFLARLAAKERVS